jgi:RNA polymerase sigma-70 factor (ECF subfamily)
MSEKEEIFLEILSKQQDRIYRLIWSYVSTKMDHDDLFQNILLKIWKGLDSFEHRSSEGTWVYRIAINACIDYTRQLDKRTTQLSSEATAGFQVAGDGDIENELIHHEKLSILYQIIHSLTPVEKTLITLYLEDLKHGEIARIIGITERHVAVKLSRIRKKINEQFKRHEEPR